MVRSYGDHEDDNGLLTRTRDIRTRENREFGTTIGRQGTMDHRCAATLYHCFHSGSWRFQKR